MRRNSISLDPITKRFTQVNDPPGRPHKIILTEEDKKRVLEEFRELFSREPDQDELEDLYVEERKVKREHLNNTGSPQG